ncbi:NADH:flavin oxidoreductase/NADH oxidase family protein [Coniochaeta sp. 2T2.1]|nr:NADH:flavin oxidoreductase/NADH oxidase family protein [Coniochaeta sp. 2T2.1]
MHNTILSLPGPDTFAVSQLERSTHNTKLSLSRLMLPREADTHCKVMATDLHKPLQVGRIKLSHRIVLAPCTRYRVDEQHKILDIVPTYYGERASVPGTLLITEATAVSLWAAGGKRTPVLETDEQVTAWKRVVDAVHERGSFIFIQLYCQGRTAIKEFRDRDGTGPAFSSSAVPLPEMKFGDSIIHRPDEPTPVEMTEEDIQRAIGDWVEAAKKAVNVAGFDGVEVHGAHGFLVDQFIQDVVNQRTDDWGGSIPNRSRFPLALATAVSDAIGSDRVGIRFSPWNTFRGMGMQERALPQFTHLISELKKLGLAYLHLIQPPLAGGPQARRTGSEENLNQPFIDLWKGTTSAIIVAGGYTAESARKIVDVDCAGHNMAVAMGRFFTSNPDLVFRIQRGIAPSMYEREFFYEPAGAKGYLGFGVSEEWEKERSKASV